MRHIEPNRDPFEVESLRRFSAQQLAEDTRPGAPCGDQAADASQADKCLNFLMCLDATTLVQPYINDMGELTEETGTVSASLELYDRYKRFVDIDRAIQVCGWASSEIIQQRLDGADRSTFDIEDNRRPARGDIESLLDQFEKGEMSDGDATVLYDRLVDFVSEYQVVLGLKWKDRIIDSTEEVEPDHLLEVVRNILKYSD